MNAVFSRRMEQFQNKVQQNINLADDELERLANYLAMVKSDIADVNDQMRRLDRKSHQIEEAKAGKEKLRTASVETVTSKMKTEHCEFMRDLQEQQTEEVCSLHKAFEENLSEIENLSTRKIHQKTAAVDEMIAKIKAQLNRISQPKEVPETPQESLEDIQDLQSFEFERQQQLEAIIEARNRERLDSLVQAKTRLSDCVHTLEEMDRNHGNNMRNYKTKMNTIDSRYQESVKRETEKHQRVIDALERKLEEVNKRGSALKKTISKIQKTHRQHVEEAVREGEMLKTSINATELLIQQAAEETAKMKAWENKAIEMRRRLETSESALYQARSENESLKREIARMRHHAHLQKRRELTATTV